MDAIMNNGKNLEYECKERVKVKNVSSRRS